MELTLIFILRIVELKFICISKMTQVCLQSQQACNFSTLRRSLNACLKFHQITGYLIEPAAIGQRSLKVCQVLANYCTILRCEFIAVFYLLICNKPCLLYTSPS